MKKIILILLYILNTFSLYAGDASTHQVIGFSKDGKYIAFERFGVYDGSAFPYSEIIIVDVIRNRYTIKPIYTMTESESVTEKSNSNQNMKKAESQLRRFRIIKGNIGKIISLTKENIDTKKDTLLAPDGSKYDIDLQEQAYFVVGEKKYHIKLQQIALEMGCHDMDNVKIFELSLTHNNKTKILQKDKRLPKLRGCPIAYQINNLYIYKNKLALFIDVSTPGFEGADIRQMIVTGTLDF